jgi:hypothetical protein
MSDYQFKIEATLPSIDGFDGAVIAGSAIGSGDLAVGDRLRVPLGPGFVELIVSGFPQIRWHEPDRRSIAVIGLLPTDDVVGSIAIQVDEDDE